MSFNTNRWSCYRWRHAVNSAKNFLGKIFLIIWVFIGETRLPIIPLMVPNYSSYKDWDRTTNGAILPFWVNLSDHLQKSASHNPNSERKKILTSSPETWTYGNTDLAVFVPLVDHFPCENSILLDFYTPRVPTISVPISEVRIQLGLRAV